MRYTDKELDQMVGTTVKLRKQLAKIRHTGGYAFDNQQAHKAVDELSNSLLKLLCDEQAERVLTRANKGAVK